MTKPFVHKDKDPSVTDEKLEQEASKHYESDRGKQVIAYLLNRLRERQYKGLTHEDAHKRWPALKRMTWLKERPDLRQQIVTELVGTKPKMARKRDLEQQARDIEDTLACGDISFKEFDEAFWPEVWATYGDCESLFHAFFREFEWALTKDENHQKDVADLVDEFLKTGLLKPILTHLQVRRAIDSKLWNQLLPIELRAEIDDARLAKQERDPKSPFTAEEELGLAPPKKFVTMIPLENLADIFIAAMKSMGFTDPNAPVDEATPPPVTAKVAETPTVAPGPLSDEGPKGKDEAKPAQTTTAPKPPPIPRSHSSSGIRMQGAPMPPLTGNKDMDEPNLDKVFEDVQKKDDPAPKANSGS